MSSCCNELDVSGEAEGRFCILSIVVPGLTVLEGPLKLSSGLEALGKGLGGGVGVSVPGTYDALMTSLAVLAMSLAFCN